MKLVIIQMNCLSARV